MTTTPRHNRQLYTEWKEGVAERDVRLGFEDWKKIKEEADTAIRKAARKTGLLEQRAGDVLAALEQMLLILSLPPDGPTQPEYEQIIQNAENLVLELK